MQKTSFAVAAATIILLSACQKSLDEQFAETCTKMRAKSEFAQRTTNMCGESGQYLPPEAKREIIEMWEHYEELQAERDALLR